MPEIDFAALKAEDAALVPAVEPKTAVVVEEVPGEATAPSGEAEAPASTEPTEAEKARSAVDKRFATLTAKRREAERRADAAEARAAELERRTQPAATEPGKLSPSQFATYEDYTAAIAKQAASGAIEEARAQARIEAQAEVQESRKGTFRERLAKEGKGIEGFPDVLETVFSDKDALHITAPMAQFLMEDADNAAPLVKWLHDNPDEAERISELRPTAQVKELVRRDGLLGKSSKPVTRAPPPVPAVGGSGPTARSIETMSHDDIKKMVKGWQK